MKQIVISIEEYEFFSIASCIQKEDSLYNKLHGQNIHVGDVLHLTVENRSLWCELFVRDIEFEDGTIWVDWIGDNE